MPVFTVLFLDFIAHSIAISVCFSQYLNHVLWDEQFDFWRDLEDFGEEKISPILSAPMLHADNKTTNGPHSVIADRIFITGPSRQCRMC